MRKVEKRVHAEGEHKGKVERTHWMTAHTCSELQLECCHFSSVFA